MDGQGKHVIVGPDGPRTIEWTQGLIDQRVRDEERHWEKRARALERQKTVEVEAGYTPEEQLRILRLGGADVEKMNTDIAEAEAVAQVEAATIRASISEKAALVRADLEARIPKEGGPSDQEVRKSHSQTGGNDEGTEGSKP